MCPYVNCLNAICPIFSRNIRYFRHYTFTQPSQNLRLLRRKRLRDFRSQSKTTSQKREVQASQEREKQAGYHQATLSLAATTPPRTNPRTLCYPRSNPDQGSNDLGVLQKRLGRAKDSGLNLNFPREMSQPGGGTGPTGPGGNQQLGYGQPSGGMRMTGPGGGAQNRMMYQFKVCI